MHLPIPSQYPSHGRCIEYGFGPVCTDPTAPEFLGVLSLSANTGETSAMSQGLFWVDEHRNTRDLDLTKLCVCYDSTYAAGVALTSTTPQTNIASGQTLQGIIQALKLRGVELIFVKVKGHMDKYPSLLRDSLCAKGNKAADEGATRGQQPAPPNGYRQQEVPEQFR